MKTDYLGDYNEYAIPHEFHAPLTLAERDCAISCANGKILGTYSFVNESVLLTHAKRRAEFTVLLANGEIIVRAGRVYKRISEQDQEGRILMAYLPIGDDGKVPEPEEVAKNHHATPATGILAKAKEVLKSRGRPKKK